MHHFVFGLNIGRSTWTSQQWYGQIYMALMGDPTLRLFPIAPVSQVTFSRPSSSVTLSWPASTDSGIVGYLIYRAATLTSTFTRLSPNFISSLTFTDSAPLSGANVYQVKAVKLETTFTGSYYNPSQAAFAFVPVGTSAPTSPTTTPNNSNN